FGEQCIKVRISFDLSHIGLTVESDLDVQNLIEKTSLAYENGLSRRISAEKSKKTEQILSIYKKAVATYANIGVTLQAQLYRSLNDLKALLHYPGSIRLVKGAFQEPSDICIPRSAKLNERYLELVDLCVKSEHRVSVATHDESIYKHVIKNGYLKN